MALGLEGGSILCIYIYIHIYTERERVIFIIINIYIYIYIYIHMICSRSLRTSTNKSDRVLTESCGHSQNGDLTREILINYAKSFDRASTVP